MYEAFPLQWPIGYPRETVRHGSNFKVTPDKARKELLAEIERLSGDKNPVISSNVPLRKRDGQMYADVANDELADPGVAIYFLYNENPVALACDHWKSPAENIRALSLTIDAIRGMGRWKCTQILERTFSGFPALPEVTAADTQIWNTLGLSSKPENIDTIKSAYKAKVILVHPDKPTGSREKFEALQDAYRKALLLYRQPP